MYNQRGFCKFGEMCTNRHDNEICQSGKECYNLDCTKRHPRDCRYFSRNGRCKFGTSCAYSHSEENNKNKVDELEKEVYNLKEEMNKLKLEMVTKMDMILEMLEKEKEVEDSSNDKEEKKDKVVTKENSTKENTEQTFKCEECEYECKRKTTLKKHMNTKHGNADKEERNDKKKKTQARISVEDSSEHKTEIGMTEKNEETMQKAKDTNEEERKVDKEITLEMMLEKYRGKEIQTDNLVSIETILNWRSSLRQDE